MVRRQVGELHPSVEEKGIAADEQYIGALAREGCECRVDLKAVLARTTWICSPRLRAAASTSLNVVSVMTALTGLTSTATRVAAGTSSRNNSSRLAANSLRKY